MYALLTLFPLEVSLVSLYRNAFDPFSVVYQARVYKTWMSFDIGTVEGL